MEAMYLHSIKSILSDDGEVTVEMMFPQVNPGAELKDVIVNKLEIMRPYGFRIYQNGAWTGRVELTRCIEYLKKFRKRSMDDEAPKIAIGISGSELQLCLFETGEPLFAAKAGAYGYIFDIHNTERKHY